MSRRLYPALGFLLFCVSGPALTARGQNQDVDQNPPPQSRDRNSIPMHPGGGPDPYAKYENDFNNVGKSPFGQQKLISQLRQKQLTEATELLLKVARDLRTEMAANPGGSLTEDEMQRLKLVEKLAHLIQDREKAQEQVDAALAKTGRAP
jgi:hypothetical protein